MDGIWFCDFNFFFFFVALDDDECLLKTDTCGVLGPNWVCRNTIGSFRCEKKRCTGPNCKSQGDSKNVNQNAVICPRGFKTDKNNKCIGNLLKYLKLKFDLNYRFILFFCFIAFADINECGLPNRCSQNELCVNTNGSYYCLPKSRNYRN